MPLGGGTFATQNKTLPGTYINIVSAALATSALSARGIVALPIEMSWGADDTMIELAAEDFYNNSQAILGYAYSHDNMKPLRDLFLNAKTAYLYKINTGGAKADSTYATALYKGVRGNDITIVIEQNEDWTAEDPLYDVTTVLGTTAVDLQVVVDMTELVDNDFVTFKSGATIAATAGTALTSGADGSVVDATYQTFLDAIEGCTYNVIGCLSTSTTIKALFSNFVKRMRDDVGVKVQCVLHKYTTADHEGIISVENDLSDSTGDDTSLLPWVIGAAAACEVNKSNTNKLYDGEYSPGVAFTQTQLEAAIAAGKFIFHNVNDSARVLMDINTLVTTTADKGDNFKSNQTVRVLDQIANDIATIFNTKYIGQIQNNASGRVSLWSDIVSHHQALEALDAIEDFDPEGVVVAAGGTKTAVTVQDAVTVVNAMEKLYMTLVIS